MENNNLNNITDFSNLYNTYFAEQIDLAVMEMLRKKGYKPRKTEQYMYNLRKRLDKQGMQFVIFTAYEYKDLSKGFNEDIYSFPVAVYVISNIVPKEKAELWNKSVREWYEWYRKDLRGEEDDCVC